MSRLTSEQRQVLKEKWQKAHDTSVPLTDPEGLSKFSYHHTKNDIDVHFIKAQSDSEIDATIVRGDVLVEKSTAEQFMNPFMSRDLKDHQQTDPNTRRVEVIEEWDDEDGHWMIKYLVMSAGAPFVSDRDLLFVGKIFKKENTTYFVGTSIDGIYEPPSNWVPYKGAVRATNVFGCQRYEELDDGDLLVTHSHQACPNGWIPISVVNMAIFNAPMSLGKVAKNLNKTVRVPPLSPSLRK